VGISIRIPLKVAAIKGDGSYVLCLQRWKIGIVSLWSSSPRWDVEVQVRLPRVMGGSEEASGA